MLGTSAQVAAPTLLGPWTDAAAAVSARPRSLTAMVARQESAPGASPRVVLVVSSAGHVLGTVSVANLNAAFG